MLLLFFLYGVRRINGVHSTTVRAGDALLALGPPSPHLETQIVVVPNVCVPNWRFARVAAREHTRTAQLQGYPKKKNKKNMCCNINYRLVALTHVHNCEDKVRRRDSLLQSLTRIFISN